MNWCENSRAMDSDDDTDVVERDPSGRYIRFDEILGKGACKTVYNGFDEVKGIEVAWNQVCIDEVVQTTDHLEMLYSEVNLLNSLKHDNILKCYYSWVDDANRTLNMITELFTSGSLRNYRRKHNNVDLKAIKNWARQILKGLVYLHTQSPPIIHRDLKCDNIFINGNTGQIKIGDLGLAVVMHQPTVNTVIGTPEFMAPELYEEEYDERVDIYSFGMCILEMVTCEYPYRECQNHAQIYKKVTSGVKPACLAKVKDSELKRFIERCLLPASSRSSAAEMLNDPFLALNKSMVQESDVKKSLLSKTIQLSNSNEVNVYSLSGKKNDDDSVSMTLKIGDQFGPAKNVNFVYYLQTDTTLSIAGEMVDALNLPYENAILIADLMDELIRKIINSRRSFESSTDEARPKFLTQSMESNSNTSSCSEMSEVVSMLNDSFPSLDDDDSKCDELKMELAAIDSEYNRRVAELEKMKTEAIENAKRNWLTRNIILVN